MPISFGSGGNGVSSRTGTKYLLQDFKKKELINAEGMKPELCQENQKNYFIG